MSVLQQAFLATMIALALFVSPAQAQAPTLNELALSFVEDKIKPNVIRTMAEPKEVTGNLLWEVPVLILTKNGLTDLKHQQFSLNETSDWFYFHRGKFQNYVAPPPEPVKESRIAKGRKILLAEMEAGRPLTIPGRQGASAVAVDVTYVRFDGEDERGEPLTVVVDLVFYDQSTGRYIIGIDENNQLVFTKAK